jgi:hypothetical protein
MIFALASFLIAFFITIGRPIAVFGKIELFLWFFSRFEQKRLIFSSLAIVSGFLAIYFNPDKNLVYWLTGFALVLILFSFLLDFKVIFPEIKEVKRKKGTQLNINDKLEVIGVEINNHAVAYPTEVVITRHIVNDTIDNTEIVVCYCALCRSGLVFNSVIDEQHLYFTVAGVWRRNMIMTDKQTGSLWQQATGECIYGHFKGRTLTLLSGENTTWEYWKKTHPESEFANECKEARSGYLSRKTMFKGLEIATTRITPPGFTDLKGLNKRETVFGISLNGIDRAYPVKELKKKPTFIDKFGDIELSIKYNENSNTMTATTNGEDRKILVERHWWLGWKEFHPDTDIWKV